MAQFDNVNYTYYSETLGRAVIETEDDFNTLKLENIQYMRRLLPYITEYEPNGIDNAVCLMIETDFKNNQIKSGESSAAISSESLGGHSVSYGSTQLNKLNELDAKSTEQQKMQIIKLFCKVNIGVK